MDFDLFTKTVDQAWNLSSTINLSFFGEPTLHPQFTECLKYLQKRPSGKDVVIFSNFLPITEEIMVEMIKTNPKRVHISINAATTNTYNTIRSGQHCVDMDGNIFTGTSVDRFRILCEKITSWFYFSHPPTRHEFVITPYTMIDAVLFARTWLPLLRGKDDILFKRILSYGGKIDDPFLVKAPCNMWNLGGFLVISWDGRVSPCFLDNDMMLEIGSINIQSLRDIYFGEKRKMMRELSIGKKISPCRECHDASHAINTIIYRQGDKCHPSDFERFA